MKVGIVTAKQIAESGKGAAHRLSLNPKYYLDRCIHCGGEENNPKHHDEQGRCGRYQRVFVLGGTSFEEEANA